MKNVFLILIAIFIGACNSNNTNSNPPVQNNDGTAVVEKVAFKDLTNQEFKKLIGQENTILLDVRTPEETADGIIEGAMEIDFQAADFKERVAALDKSKTYLVYCRSGGRSASACDMMSDMGFSNLYNLPNGYSGWEK